MRSFSMVLLACVVLGAPALAQAPASKWPERPITIIVPFPAGSATDAMARILASGFGKRLNQSIIIENRAGGDGINGTRATARSAPDGYTFTIGTPSSYATAPTMHAGTLPYDPVKDLTPVSLLGRTPYLLVVAPNLGVKSVDELVALAKRRPKLLNYSSVGEGSVARIGMLLFANDRGIELTHIPYKTSAQSIIDVSTGIIQLQLATVPPTLSLYQSDRVKILAVTGSKRLGLLPDIRTLQEEGVADFDVTFWFALFAPAGVSPDIMERMGAAVRETVDSPEVRDALRVQGIDPETSSSGAMAAIVQQDIARYRDVIVKAQIRTVETGQ